MTYWTATVERPDGDGGWILVDVFGRPDHPDGMLARHLHGDTALDAAQLLLGHLWPTNLDKFLKREDPGKYTERRNAGIGIAGHRITLVVDKTKAWTYDVDKPPGPAVYTVGELRLADIRAEVAEVAEAQAKVNDLAAQLKKARGDLRYHKGCKDALVDEAARADVPEADIARAARAPRRRRKTT